MLRAWEKEHFRSKGGKRKGGGGRGGEREEEKEGEGKRDRERDRTGRGDSTMVEDQLDNYKTLNHNKDI